MIYERGETRRTVSPEAEEILGKEFPVLDHGFVRLVDYMGNDGAIVQAARTSVGAGVTDEKRDRGLIRYLWRHEHTSPFEMVEMKWHCKMPIFVAREWIRRRTANVNELSMRYSEPIGEYYIPSPEEFRFQGVTNIPGSSEEEVPEDVARRAIEWIKSSVSAGEAANKGMRKDKIARELARMALPINAYTEWYWKNDLKNTLHFLKLRMAPNAQKEIRVYANAMAEIVKKVVPVTWEAFEDYTLNARKFSRQELEALKTIMGRSVIIPQDDIEKVAQETFPDKFERREFLEKFVLMNGE